MREILEFLAYGGNIRGTHFGKSGGFYRFRFTLGRFATDLCCVSLDDPNIVDEVVMVIETLKRQYFFLDRQDENH